MGHQYKVELDIISSAGEDGIRRLAGEDNPLYIDFQELEKRGSERSKDPHQYEFERVLGFINKYRDLELAKRNKEIVLPTGGKLTWAEAPENVVHLTRSSSKTSELSRMGLKVEFPNFLRFSINPLKSGLVDIFYNGDPKEISVEEIEEILEVETLYPNQYVRINGSIIYLVEQSLNSNEDKTRFSLDGEPRLVRIPSDKIENFYVKTKLPGFSAWNLEQMLCYDRTVSKNVEVSFITGGSGSGKSILAYASALEEILGTKEDRNNEDIKDGIILFKSNDIIAEDKKSRDLGLLPGTAFQKTYNFMKSFADAHNLCGINPGQMPFRQMLYHPREENIEEGFEKRSCKKIGEFYLSPKYPAIEIEHLQYCRGRTFINKVIVIDEAPNYTPFEMKQLLERVGEKCKVIIIGDPEKQIDNPKLSRDFNGLVYAAKILREEHPRVSFMHLDRNYRSQTAEIMRRHDAVRIG